MTNRGNEPADRPRRIGESLDSLSRQFGQHGVDETARLFSRWTEIVGAALAAHVTPLRFDGTTLVVQVDHPAWATQLRLLGSELLDRVGAVPGIDRPTSLDIRVGS
jgi:predicted nucleic acid-binding Zn ribbon protein